MSKLSLRIKKFLYINFLQLLSPSLQNRLVKPLQKNADYLNWINYGLVEIANDFVNTYNLNNSFFIKQLNLSFRTNCFELLLKRWMVDYLFLLFNTLFDFYNSTPDSLDKFLLFDSPLNRFAAKKFCQKFNTDFNRIEWLPQISLSKRFLSVFIQLLRIIFISLRSGVKIINRKKSYKVMREAVWGLYDTGGYYFHDDFFVDGDKIKTNDLLLFSRVSVKWNKSRLKAYDDIKRSNYGHFYLPSLSIGVNTLLSRVIPRYIFAGSRAILSQLNSPNFLLFQSIYWDFTFYALAYEKVFSHFKVTSELGHNYFSASHISESIVCQNYGVKYYLMHWSDNSGDIYRFISSFLGCDKYLVWGRVHFRDVERSPDIMAPTGYFFKAYIKKVANERAKILHDMNIEAKGKIITFFDESFGGNILMTEQQYIVFWETALKVALAERDSTIVIKPKGLSRYNNLSLGLKNNFLEIKKQLERVPNAYILNSNRWSFIEAIGISDIVITQGMTSSATIAIICGIQGLYLDQANTPRHPFSEFFKDKLVFNDPNKLIGMIHNIIHNQESPLKNIPIELLRQYDAFADDFAMDRLRDILTGSKKKVGIVIQARMGSTRLPGKVMLELKGKPVLQHIIERLKLCQGVDDIILATTINKKDDVLAELAKKNNLKVFRGSEEDVLSRYYYAAKENNLDIIVRITADCPFVDPYMLDDMAERFLQSPGVDYLSNGPKRTFPRGLDIEIFNFTALEKAFQCAKNPHEREHVTPYIYEHRELFRIHNIENDCDLSHLRWTLDEEKDFEFISEIYKRLYNEGKIFLTNDILKVLNDEPWLSEINAGVKQKVGSK